MPCITVPLVSAVLSGKQHILILYLRFDVDFLRCMFIEPLHVDLAVKVANVADDGVILHVLKVSVEKITPHMNT